MTAIADAAETSRAGAAPSVASLEQAAQWYATLRDEDVADTERAAWHAWLAASDEHARAWRHIEAVSRRFEPLRGAGGAGAAVAGIRTARHPAPGRRRVAKGMAGMFALGVAGWLGWRHSALPLYVAAVRADHRTDTGERRELALADGTRVWLNTGTALDVDYGSAARRLALHAGEILVDTSPDSQGRPFHVLTRFGSLHALGTRFTVRQDERRTRLDVFEGAVAIHGAAGRARRIGAGEAALFDGAGIGWVGAADRARAAWTHGRLPADDVPLGELLAELGRYRHGHLSVAPEVARLRVMGVYPLDDTDRALAMLERNLPIRVRHTLPWWTTVEARHAD